MIDFWPGEPIQLSGDLLLEPMTNLIFGLSIAIVGALLFGRFFKDTWFARRMILDTAVGDYPDDSVGEAKSPI